MFTAAAIAILVTMAVGVARAIAGPTIYDRILAVNVFGTKTVLFLAVVGFLTGRPDFLDIGLVYALINFIGVIGVLKLVEHGDLGK
jgi:multicomponent Na+:H+ antiporter subunit F